MNGIMQGKRGLIMGVANNHSIAWGISKALAAQGAELAFTYQGEALGKRVKPLAAELGSDFIVPCDVEDIASVDALFATIREKWGSLDFVVHAIGFSDKNELKGLYADTTRENFSRTMVISCFSFTEIAKRAAELMTNGGSMLTLTYNGSQRVIPNYNVMGVAKAALEASVRYLAADYGPRDIRVNAISAGPVRTLAGGSGRAIVQAESHLYMDSGDCVQTLSNITLMPLAPGAATFTRADVEAVLTRTAGGRVAADVGAILIETPIRRLSGQMFDWDEARRITAFARERGIGTHLDGARLFIASVYTGISPAEYAASFDTVYVSLWKYFNSGIGAILAGPKRVLDGMFHVRRMFGGNLAVGWPAALVAGHYMDGFVERLKTAVRVSEDFYAGIATHPKVTVERIPNGTNLTRLRLKDVDAASLGPRLAARGVRLPGISGNGVVMLGVNETWNRTTAAELTRAFEQALG